MSIRKRESSARETLFVSIEVLALGAKRTAPNVRD